MERGTKRESRAVHERWRELEHERRERLHHCSSRLFGGAFLVLAGLTFLLLFLAEDACVHAGPIPHGCMTVIPGPVELVLFLLAPLAAAVGTWLGWTSVRERPLSSN